MTTDFDSNMKLLMGGSFQGGTNWSKPANDIDKCFKIYYFIEGEATVTSGNINETLFPNNLYFINGYTLSSQHCANSMHVHWLHFIPGSLYLSHLLKTNFFVVPLNISLFTSFIPLFSKLDNYFDRAKPFAQKRDVTLEIQSFVQFVVAQILKQHTATDFETTSNHLRLLPALEFINLHYHSNIRLGMLAEESCLSPNYFHRIFKKTFSMTPFDYIEKMRMEEAIRLLSYTDTPVKEISYSIGYEDEAYFSRIFSKTYQESPGRYRKINANRLP